MCLGVVEVLYQNVVHLMLVDAAGRPHQVVKNPVCVGMVGETGGILQAPGGVRRAPFLNIGSKPR